MATHRQLMDIFTFDLADYHSKSIETEQLEIETEPEQLDTEKIAAKIYDALESEIDESNFNQTEFYSSQDTNMDFNESKPSLGELNLNSTGINFFELEPKKSEITETNYNEITADITQTKILSTNSPTDPPKQEDLRPSLGDIFFYIGFAWIIFNMIDKYLNRNRTRERNPILDPIPVIDKTEEELNDHIVTKTIVPCSLSDKKDENNPETKPDEIDNTMGNMEEGNIDIDSSTISADQFALDFSEDKTCAICIDTFEIGDEVSWSRYHKCDHVFHYDCIIPWLKQHDECPYCRCNYIMPDLNRTELADDFIYCVDCGLVKLGESCNDCAKEPEIQCCNSKEMEISPVNSSECETSIIIEEEINFV